MEKYVRPEMEIDLLDDNCDLVTTSGGDPGGCGIPGCTINFAYGEDVDPW